MINLETIEFGMMDLSIRKYFLETEEYANLSKNAEKFYEQYKDELLVYNQKWDALPIYQWSRQIEYPFFLSAINHFSKNKLNVKCLDAGSGVTFFPYYIEQTLPQVKITCVDYDPIQKELHNKIATKGKSAIQFDQGDLRQLKYPDSTFDIIYCVSVLEHIPGHDKAILEMKRVLKPDGILILSFDISLDNRRDISPENFQKLKNQLETNFEPVLKEGTPRNPLTTNKVYNLTKDRRLLPWKQPWKNWLKELSKGRTPVGIYELGLFCQIYRKK